MKTAELISKAAMLLIAALSVIFIALSASEAEPMADGSWTANIITWTVVVLVIGLGLAVISEALNAILDTKSLIKSVIALIGAAILIAIFWSLADGTPLNMIGYEGDQNTYGWLKIADTSIFTCYFALAVAAIAIVASEIINIFK